MKKLLILMVTILITLTYCRKKIFDKRNKLVGTYEIHVKEHGYSGGYFDTIYVITGEIKIPNRSDPLPCPGNYFSACPSFCEKENEQIILSTQQFTYYISYDPVENTLDKGCGMIKTIRSGKVYLNGFRYEHYSYSPGGHWQITLVGIKK